MIEAGETGGILDIILQRLAIYVEKAVRLRAAVKSALVYPVAVVSLAFLIVGALLKWVVPIFANLFIGLGVALPLPTRIVMGLSSFVGQFWWFFFIGGAGLVFGVKQIRKDPRGRYAFDYMLLKLPILGQLLRKIAVARFTRTLGTLITSGVPIFLEGLSITAKTSGNAVLEEALMKVRKAIEEGRTIVDPLRETGLPQHGYPDDRSRRSHRRHGCHVAEDRRLLRGRSGCRHQGHVGHVGTGHHRPVGRHDWRHCNFALHAAVLHDRETGRLRHNLWEAGGAISPGFRRVCEPLSAHHSSQVAVHSTFLGEDAGIDRIRIRHAIDFR